MTIKYTSTEHYVNLCTTWAKSVNSKDFYIPAASHILYNILCNKKADSGFTNVTNPIKLLNGCRINQGFLLGLDILRVCKDRHHPYSKNTLYRPFGPHVTKDMHDQINIIVYELFLEALQMEAQL